MGSSSSDNRLMIPYFSPIQSEFLQEKVLKMTQYTIPTIANDTLRNLANFGIKLLNSPMKYMDSDQLSYPYHWFLIIETEKSKFLVQKASNKDIRKIESYEEGFNIVKQAFPGECYFRGSIGDIKEGTTMKDVVDYAISLPEKYHVIFENCQDFVSSIMVQFYAGGEEGLKLVLAGSNNDYNNDT